MATGSGINAVLTQKPDWATHIKNYRRSGLSAKSYSQREGLKYDTFLYHYRKSQPSSKKNKLIPVQIKQSVGPENVSTLCKIELRSGDVLYVHDQSVLMAILSVLL